MSWLFNVGEPTAQPVTQGFPLNDLYDRKPGSAQQTGGQLSGLVNALAPGYKVLLPLPSEGFSYQDSYGSLSIPVGDEDMLFSRRLSKADHKFLWPAHSGAVEAFYFSSAVQPDMPVLFEGDKNFNDDPDTDSVEYRWYMFRRSPTFGVATGVTDLSFGKFPGLDDPPGEGSENPVRWGWSTPLLAPPSEEVSIGTDGMSSIFWTNPYYDSEIGVGGGETIGHREPGVPYGDGRVSLRGGLIVPQTVVVRPFFP